MPTRRKADAGALTLEMLQAAADAYNAKWSSRPNYLVVGMPTVRLAGDVGRRELHDHLDRLARAAGRHFLGAAIVPHPPLEATGYWYLGGGRYPYPRPKVSVAGADGFTGPFIDDPQPAPEPGSTWADVVRSGETFWRSQL